MSSDVKEILEDLSSQTSHVKELSLAENRLPVLGKIYGQIQDVEKLGEILKHRREYPLYRNSCIEYQLGMLALIHGQYRNAFKSLRLVLELSLQAILLSGNELLLIEWLNNRSETSWAKIICEEHGVFGRRFANAFFPELNGIVAHYRTMSAAVYRECSECVHGNISSEIFIPTEIKYDENIQNLWLEKADSVSLLIFFATCMRYLSELNAGQVDLIRDCVIDNLGHVEPIRTIVENKGTY